MMSHTDESKESPQSSRVQPPKSSRSIFDVPAPIKQLFDRFPLLTYPTNELPQRAPQHRDAHVLYIFTSEHGARRGLPSFNPACLKWQVRASYDVPRWHTHHTLGLPQILQDRLHDSSGEQSCIAKRLPSIRDSGFPRAIQAHPACTIREAAEMGHEQQQAGHRGER
jgi:hypothetical protein